MAVVTDYFKNLIRINSRFVITSVKYTSADRLVISMFTNIAFSCPSINNYNVASYILNEISTFSEALEFKVKTLLAGLGERFTVNFEWLFKLMATVLEVE